MHRVYLPGDNDIGGEGTDKRTAEKMQRFNRVFHDDKPHAYRNIDFLPVRYLMISCPIFLYRINDVLTITLKD